MDPQERESSNREDSRSTSSMKMNDYPADVSISDDEYRELKAALTSNDDWKCYVEEWPPTDAAGNAYPLWFTVDELNERGELIDSFNNNYNPFAGNRQPVSDDDITRCNTPLKNWRERYPSIRFCGQMLDVYDDDYTYCYIHKGRDNVNTAEEQIQTGLHVKSLDYLYEKLSPWKKLVGWGTFESLMGESNYEYGVEYEPRRFDFSDEPFVPDGADEDDVLDVKCGYPTQYNANALYLYVAAMQTVQLISVQPKIMREDREAGEGMMESRQIETAQLTAPPSEHDPSPQEFKTIETWGEHHLNLPMSRLIKDQPRLLEMGGVDTDPDSESDTASADDLVLEIEADPDAVETTEDTGTDPNQLGDDLTAESERILEGDGDA